MHDCSPLKELKEIWVPIFHLKIIVSKCKHFLYEHVYKDHILDHDLYLKQILTAIWIIFVGLLFAMKR